MNRGEHTAIMQRAGGVRPKLHLWHRSDVPLCGSSTTRSDVSEARPCPACRNAWYRRTRDTGALRTIPWAVFADAAPAAIDRSEYKP